MQGGGSNARLGGREMRACPGVFSCATKPTVSLAIFEIKRYYMLHIMKYIILLEVSKIFESLVICVNKFLCNHL